MHPGPPRMPTPLLEARGSNRPGRRRSEGALELPPEIPAAPATLSPGAAAIWSELVEVLGNAKVLSRADRRELTRLCCLYESWDRCQAEIDAKGAWDEEGETSAGKRQMRIGEQLTRLAQQFGLTPSARASLRLPKDKTEKRDKKRDDGRFFRAIPGPGAAEA